MIYCSGPWSLLLGVCVLKAALHSVLLWFDAAVVRLRAEWHHMIDAPDRRFKEIRPLFLAHFTNPAGQLLALTR